MFRFASPLYLFLIVLPFVFWFFRIVRENQVQIRVPSLDGIGTAAFSSVLWISRWLEVLKVAGLICLILALARPQWGDRKVNVTTEGVNIILAMDLSESMRALDFKKDGAIVTRLEAVKSVVREFIKKRDGDRIGMVVFGSNAYTQLPLTRDYNTISFILDQLQIGAAGPRTAIGDAIGISLRRLEDIESKSNIIILLTDGKSNSGEIPWEDAAAIAAGRNVKIYTIAVGSRGKAPFLVNGLFGQRYVYQNVDVDLDALKTIARTTSGEFFQAKDTDGLARIYEMINQLEKTKVDVNKWVEYREMYPFFLYAGLGCYLVLIVLRSTRFLKVP